MAEQTRSAEEPKELAEAVGSFCGHAVIWGVFLAPFTLFFARSHGTAVQLSLLIALWGGIESLRTAPERGLPLAPRLWHAGKRAVVEASMAFVVFRIALGESPAYTALLACMFGAVSGAGVLWGTRARAAEAVDAS